MSSNKVSASRALVTLKHLDISIKSDIAQAQYTYVKKGDKEIVSGKDDAAIKQEVDAAYQSIRDKMNTFFNLRQGLNKINQSTKIKVGNRELTILDALTYRHYVIPKLEQLYNAMLSDYNRKSNEYQKADALFEQALLAADNNELKEALIKANKPELYQIGERISQVKQEIDYFNTEFDVLMTELNPTLFIE